VGDIARAGFLGGGCTSVSTAGAVGLFFFFIGVVVSEGAGEAAALLFTIAGEVGLEEPPLTAVPVKPVTIVPAAKRLPSFATTVFFFFATGLSATFRKSDWIPETSLRDKPSEE